MIQDLSQYTIYIALLSAIPGIFFYNKLPNNKAKSLLCFIWLSFIIDYIGLHFWQWTGILAYPIYSLYILFSFSYYIILLKSLLIKINNQRFASVTLFTFWLFYVIDFTFLQNILTKTLTYSFFLGVFLLLAVSCLYLLEIFNSKKILNFKKSIFFWFVIGILIFNVTFLPYMIAIDFVLVQNLRSILNLVLFVLNLFMHCCFLIGFIWSEKRYNY